MKTWDVLGKKHAIDVLLEISEHPGRIQTELADKRNPASGSRRARLADLVDAGYVNAKSVKGAQSSIAYSLTPEGERVCGLLREIEYGEFTGKYEGGGGNECDRRPPRNDDRRHTKGGPA